ncbi:MAG: hypothetical protein KDB21_19500 [Acidimicrobiales bacterium]|nr:hypothetical protein [Acidimicrobiales bacterium]
MSKARIERRLQDVSDQLKQLRSELSVADEQLAHFADEADDARIRSLVSETPLASKEHREAARHVEAMRRHREQVADRIVELERSQDDLLDQLIEAGP